MLKQASRRWMPAMAAAGAAMLAGAPAPAAAQVRAAIVKNVDEPGRTPFEATIQYDRFGCVSANCSNFRTQFATDLSFDGPQVPAGKRLVVQSFVAIVPTDSAPCFAALKTFPGPVSSTGLKAASSTCTPVPQGYIASGLAFATYEPGESIHVMISGQRLNGVGSAVTVTGYLIDATN